MVVNGSDEMECPCGHTAKKLWDGIEATGYYCAHCDPEEPMTSFSVTWWPLTTKEKKEEKRNGNS